MKTFQYKLLKALAASKKRTRANGFSLIELVIVVAVLAILAAIAIPAFNSVAEDGRKAAAKTTLATAYKECEVSKASSGTATHTTISSTVSGVVYTGDITGTACAAGATAVTTGGNTFTIGLHNGSKGGAW